MKKITIKLNLRPVWKQAKGAPAPLSGAGEHKDKRSKRLRTRQARNRAAIKEQSE